MELQRAFADEPIGTATYCRLSTSRFKLATSVHCAIIMLAVLLHCQSTIFRTPTIYTVCEIETNEDRAPYL